MNLGVAVATSPYFLYDTKSKQKDLLRTDDKACLKRYRPYSGSSNTSASDGRPILGPQGIACIFLNQFLFSAFRRHGVFFY